MNRVKQDDVLHVRELAHGRLDKGGARHSGIRSRFGRDWNTVVVRRNDQLLALKFLQEPGNRSFDLIWRCVVAKHKLRCDRGGRLLVCDAFPDLDSAAAKIE